MNYMIKFYSVCTVLFSLFFFLFFLNCFLVSFLFFVSLFVLSLPCIIYLMFSRNCPCFPFFFLYSIFLSILSSFPFIRCFSVSTCLVYVCSFDDFAVFLVSPTLHPHLSLPISFSPSVSPLCVSRLYFLLACPSLSLLFFFFFSPSQCLLILSCFFSLSSPSPFSSLFFHFPFPSFSSLYHLFFLFSFFSSSFFSYLPLRPFFAPYCRLFFPSFLFPIFLSLIPFLFPLNHPFFYSCLLISTPLLLLHTSLPQHSSLPFMLLYYMFSLFAYICEVTYTIICGSNRSDHFSNFRQLQACLNNYESAC